MSENETPLSDLSETSTAPVTAPSLKDTDNSEPSSPTFQSEQDRLAYIGNLLSGDEGVGNSVDDDIPAVDEPSGNSVDDDIPAVDELSAEQEPETLNDKAKELGIEPEELYHLNVTTRDGEEVSVETLKDFYADQRGRDAELNGRDAQIIQRQQVLLAAAQAGKLTEDGYAAVKNELDERVRHEQSRFLDLVPELQDEAKLEVFSRDVERVMGQFGYQRHEMMFTDHRQALFIRRFAQLEKELDAERAKNRPKPQTARKPNGRGANTPNRPKQPGAGASKMDRLNFISGLIQKG